MVSVFVIRERLLETEKLIDGCKLHYQLAEPLRVVSRLLTESGEIDYLSIREQLRSFTANIPDCKYCSNVASRIFDLEDQLARDAEISEISAAPDLVLPAEPILRKRIIFTYPFPISRSYSQIFEVENPRVAIDRIIDAFDFSYRYCGYLLLASLSLQGKSSEQMSIAKEAWKSMARLTLGFQAGIGGIIKRVGSSFQLSNPFFSSLALRIEQSRGDIQDLIGLRNRVKHETGGFSYDSLSEDFAEIRKGAEESLNRFLWRVNCLTHAKLIYLRRPLSFLEDKQRMEYEVADCMGSSDDFEIRRMYLRKETLFGNRKVCLSLEHEEDREKEFPGELAPLYPLLVTFHTPPKGQVYLYHDYDTATGHFTFVHPFHREMRVTGKGNEDLYGELDRRIRYGILERD